MTSPHLANSPLNEVVCELRFPGSFSVLAGLDRFQQAVAEDFPHLLVPNVSSGEAPAIKPYRLVSADRSELVSIGLTTFSFISRNYSVFSDYKQRLDELVALFRNVYWPEEFSRLGLRYINALPPAPAPSLGTIHPWLNLSLHVPELETNNSTAGNAAFMIEEADLLLRISFEYDLSLRDEDRVFLLDFDCFQRGHISGDGFDEFLAKGHSLIDRTFFSLLSERGLAEAAASQ